MRKIALAAAIAIAASATAPNGPVQCSPVAEQAPSDDDGSTGVGQQLQRRALVEDADAEPVDLPAHRPQIFRPAQAAVLHRSGLVGGEVVDIGDGRQGGPGDVEDPLHPGRVGDAAGNRHALADRLGPCVGAGGQRP